MRITIGIDISKDTLDAYQLPDNQHIQVANDKTGHKTLSRWIGAYNQPLSCSRQLAHITAILRRRLLPATRRLPRSTHCKRAGLPKQRDAWQKPIALTLTGWRKWVLSWN